MKILQVNVNACSGSTGKIATDIKNTLEAQGHECIIAYGANDNVNQPGYYRICSESERKINALISRITGVNHGLFLPFSLNRLKKLISKEKPDIVHLQCPNGYIVDLFRLLKLLGESGLKTVVTNHAEYFYTGTCGHAMECNRWLTGCGKCPVYSKETYSRLDHTAYSWRQMKEAFNSFIPNNLIITSVSPWLKSRSEQSPYLNRFKQEVVMNGLDDSVFHLRQVPESIFRQFDSKKPIALFVSASFDNTPDNFKGGDKIVELVRLMPDVQFCVVATYNKLSGEIPGNVKIWGRARNQEELANLYSLADCTILASKRETFSMVTAESLCCGTPVVGFKAGGPESIAIPEYSKFIEYGNVVGLSLAVRNMLERKINRTTVSEQAIGLYSKRKMANNYLKVYKSLVNKD